LQPDLQDSTDATSGTVVANELSVRAALVAALVISVFTLSIATFELALADWPSGFVLLVVVPLVALLFFGCIVWCGTLLLKVRSDGVKFALPFLICVITMAILAWAPLHRIALQQNFHWHHDSRERIVGRVEVAERTLNVSHESNLIAFGDNEPNVSAGGNAIVVEETDEGTYVLFLTSRGLKHAFTGFLRIPPGGDPNNFFEFDGKPPRQVERYGKNWYFVAN